MDIRYLVPRLARHFLQSSLTRFLLRRGWIIQPGLETRAPLEAAQRYALALDHAGFPLQGKRVLVFGYGGRFAIACALLRLGALHVTLCEKDTPPDHRRNAALLPEFSDYLMVEAGRVVPAPAFIHLAEGDIRQLAARKTIPPSDLVLSSSVYEHLDDVSGITAALAALTCPGGAQLHYVDLRDHFFKYPFEMLCYSERVWYGWLNPTSNHNRYRYNDYLRVFSQYFQQVDIEVLERNEAAFQQTQARIRPEFLSGDPQVDSITLIKILARVPVTPGIESA